MDESEPYKFGSKKHPDPETNDAWSVRYPGLQVRGVWTKIKTRINNSPPGRGSPVAWIWRSKIFTRWVEGGRVNHTW